MVIGAVAKAIRRTGENREIVLIDGRPESALAVVPGRRDHRVGGSRSHQRRPSPITGIVLVSLDAVFVVLALVLQAEPVARLVRCRLGNRSGVTTGTVVADSGVDAVVVIGCGLTPQDNHKFVDDMIQVQRGCHKPFLIVKIPGFDPSLGRQFCEAGLPFFDSAERALWTYATVCRYQRWRQEMSDCLF